jgi:hypothetical protein
MGNSKQAAASNFFIRSVAPDINELANPDNKMKPHEANASVQKYMNKVAGLKSDARNIARESLKPGGYMNTAISSATKYANKLNPIALANAGQAALAKEALKIAKAGFDSIAKLFK